MRMLLINVVQSNLSHLKVSAILFVQFTQNIYEYMQAIEILAA